jgi:hypothetical protein
MIQTAAYFRHEFFGNVNGKAAPWEAAVKDIA